LLEDIGREDQVKSIKFYGGETMKNNLNKKAGIFGLIGVVVVVIIIAVLFFRIF